MTPAYAIDGLRHQRGRGSSVFELWVPTFTIAQGARVALTGTSGCGKSTLLDILALILLPNRVERFLIGVRSGSAVDITSLQAGQSHTELAHLRNRGTGYVLQTGALLPYLSVAQNIALPMELLGLSDDGAVTRMARRLQIERHLRKKPGELSVGERQRVAIARALVHEPAVVLADEPTAALDPDTSDVVMHLLTDMADEAGTTLIVASHDWERVDRFGLTRIRPSIERTEGSACVRSTFVH